MKIFYLSIIALFLFQTINAQLIKTRVQIEVQRPANWNTAGMRRIAIEPFKDNSQSVQFDLANYLTDAARDRVNATGQFTVISASHVEDMRRRGENLANHVDVLLVGKVLNIEYKDDSQTYTSKNRQGEQTTSVTYTREVKLEIEYSLERARDRSVIGTSKRSGSASDRNENHGKLRSTRDLLRQINVLQGLSQDLAPHTITETRTLMGDRSQGSELRNSMRSASDQVKAKNYRVALNMYMRIYDQYRSFSALYNASVMHEALGDIPAAIEVMEKAERETGNQDARTELARLRRIVSDREKISAHHSADGPVERVIRHASNESFRYLPDGARVSLYNNSIGERDLASRIIEGMSTTFRQRGINIVDRDHTQHIDRELQIQYSGMVSDETILNVGKQVGASITIIVEVTGVGGNRRLKMTVLDIEEGKPLLQSDGSSNWEL